MTFLTRQRIPPPLYRKRHSAADVRMQMNLSRVIFISLSFFFFLPSIIGRSMIFFIIAYPLVTARRIKIGERFPYAHTDAVGG